MAKRKTLSKKIRFEVFKRDSFTCQYCGSKSPDVILHVDHIDPVSKGGGDDMLNLITSCVDCNQGKKDIRLSDNSTIEKQRAQLAELNERREQLEMMLAWREGLANLKESEIDIACEAWENVASRDGRKWQLNESGIQQLKKHVRKFGLKPVLEAIDLAAEQYFQFDDKGVTAESVNFAWAKVGGICNIRSRPEGDRIQYYIRGILRKNFRWTSEPRARAALEAAAKAGVDPEHMVSLAKEARYFDQWEGWMEAATKEASGG